MTDKCPYPTNCGTLRKYIEYSSSYISRVNEICNTPKCVHCFEYKFLEEQKAKQQTQTSSDNLENITLAESLMKHFQ